MPIIPASDPALPQVLSSVNVGSGPTLAVYDPATQEVYVVNAISNTVSVLNGTAVVATVPLGTTNLTVGDPVAAVYDPSSGYVLRGGPVPVRRERWGGQRDSRDDAPSGHPDRPRTLGRRV